MSTKFSLTLDILAYDAADVTNDPADGLKLKKKVEEAAVTEITRNFPIQIADAVTDQAIQLPDSTTDYLIILTDQQVSIKLNGSATAQILKPKAAGKKTPVLMIRGDITALTISNASGSAANLDIIAVQI